MNIVARPWEPQDLIDDLQMIIDEEPINYLNSRCATLCMARDYLKEHFAEPRWISVEERLPEPYHTVLVCKRHLDAPDCYMTTDFRTPLYGDTVVWASELKTWKSGVTHWMPLPEPPEVEA